MSAFSGFLDMHPTPNEDSLIKNYLLRKALSVSLGSRVPVENCISRRTNKLIGLRGLLYMWLSTANGVHPA